MEGVREKERAKNQLKMRYHENECSSNIQNDTQQNQMANVLIKDSKMTMKWKQKRKFKIN